MDSPNSLCMRDVRFVSVQPQPGGPIRASDSRMESFGAAAAISQFLVQLIATVDLAKRLKGSSKSLKRYQEQLEGLRSLCEEISSNPALGTDEVQRETQSILHTIDSHKDVSNLLKRGRIYRSIGFILKERSFMDLFATLENKKTTLSLRVHSNNSMALDDIRHQITSMSVSTSLLDHLIRASFCALPDLCWGYFQRNTLAYGQLAPPFSPPPSMEWQQSHNHQHELVVSRIQAPRHNRNCMGYGSQTSENTQQRAVYRHNTAGHNVQQHLGPVVRGRFLAPSIKFGRSESVYERNDKHGAGIQVQGLTYEPPGPPGGVLNFVPVAAGQYSGNRHDGMGHGPEFGESMQVLGTLVQ